MRGNKKIRRKKMKKKILILLSCLVLCICAMGALSACGEDTEPCEAHTFGEWEVTAAPTCGAEGSQKQTCSACGTSVTEAIPATQEHNYVDAEITTPPTCGVKGERKQVCSVCNASKNAEIPALEHNYVDVAESVVPPTCGVAGSKTQKCEHCGDEKTGIELPALVHNYVDVADSIVEPTCGVAGSKTQECEHCGDEITGVEIPALVHKYGPWTELASATCEAAGEEIRQCSLCYHIMRQEIPALEHEYGAWNVTTPAACGAAGESERICSLCDKKETQIITALEHKYSDWIVTAEASCIKDGERKKVCSLCNDEIVETVYANSIPHSYGEPDKKDASCGDGEIKETCSVCGYVKTTRIPGTGEHVFPNEWTVQTPATCGKNGLETKECSVCNFINKHTIPATGEHSYPDEWTQTKAPACEVKGENQKSCMECNYTLKEAIPALEHDWGEWDVKLAETCSTRGQRERICALCEAVDVDYTSATGEHLYGEWEIVTDASCLTDGERTRKCGTCNRVDKNRIPATGHDFSEGAANCKACGEATAVVEYTIIVKSIAGLPIGNISCMLYSADNLDNVINGAFSDKDGVAKVKLDNTKTYVVKLPPLDGYTVNADGYSIVGTETTIVLAPFVIPSEDESDYAEKKYQLGDVMYDFTFTNMQGETLKLSELLTTGGKKGVLLNFWYVDCTYCRQEFPYLNAVYERYKNEITVIGLNPSNDTVEDINICVATDGLTFDIVKGGVALQNAFNVTGFPTSVFIDRYGVITFIEAGALPSERPFEELFSKAIVEDYQQIIYKSVDELIPVEKPEGSMPDSETVGGVLNSGDINITYYPEDGTADAEYSWPFILVDKDGDGEYDCIRPSNTIYSSYSIMHADVFLNKGDAFVFDYWSSTEEGADILYVLVDGLDIIALHGETNDWVKACAFVALESRVHKVSFIYMKDVDTDVGEDTVYLKNFRIENSEELDVETYIQRECASDLKEDGSAYETYVKIFLGSDGYYHVGSAEGPLLLADLMNRTLFVENDSVYNMALNGLIVYQDKDYYEELVKYCNYASNSDISGLCPVNEELMQLLIIVSKVVGNGVLNSNDWLEICKYYDAYGTDGKQLEDPIKGLAPHSAFDTVVNTNPSKNDEQIYPNTVVYEKIIMPRGLLYKFVPTLSGVYRIMTDSKLELFAWIFDANMNQLAEYEALERFMPVNNENVCMYMYFEAGETYYIDVAFYEVTQLGTFTFKIDYLADSYTIFAAASPGFFTTTTDEAGNMTETVIAGGIDVKLGNDGYYHHVLPDGTLGSIVYVDFTLPTNVFTSHPVYHPEDPYATTLLTAGAFDFTYSELDEAWFENGYDKMTDDELREAWGKQYEDFYKKYKVDDLRNGIYHGLGGDDTERIQWYIDNKLLDDTNCDDPNLYGCVAVDAELAIILQKLMDTRTFAGVKNSWTKMCYYYLTYGA